jgi:hypothetical protein
MEEEKRRRRARSYLIGGVLGASATVAAVRRLRPRRAALTGLGAFESAPCYRELLERERSEGP